MINTDSLCDMNECESDPVHQRVVQGAGLRHGPGGGARAAHGRQLPRLLATEINGSVG